MTVQYGDCEILTKEGSFEKVKSLVSKQTQQTAVWEDGLGSQEILDSAMADEGGWRKR